MRIFLIIALVAGLAAIGIDYVVYGKLTQAITERDDYNSKWKDETKAKNDALAKLKKTGEELTATKTKLTQTESDLTAANAKVTDLTTQNTDLAANLDKTKGERDAAQQELDKWRQLSVTPEQVKGIIADLAKLHIDYNGQVATNKLLARDRDDWKKRYQDIAGANEQVLEPPGLVGKILDVDPKYGFVVLNIGSDNGVIERGDMIIDNNGRYVGKVHIVSVGKNTSIANILPDWTRGEINEDSRVID
jgi:cell shape-determining protein MreC